MINEGVFQNSLGFRKKNDIEMKDVRLAASSKNYDYLRRSSMSQSEISTKRRIFAKCFEISRRRSLVPSVETKEDLRPKVKIRVASIKPVSERKLKILTYKKERPKPCLPKTNLVFTREEIFDIPADSGMFLKVSGTKYGTRVPREKSTNSRPRTCGSGSTRKNMIMEGIRSGTSKSPRRRVRRVSMGHRNVPSKRSLGSALTQSMSVDGVSRTILHNDNEDLDDMSNWLENVPQIVVNEEDEAKKGKKKRRRKFKMFKSSNEEYLNQLLDVPSSSSLYSKPRWEVSSRACRSSDTSPRTSRRGSPRRGGNSSGVCKSSDTSPWASRRGSPRRRWRNSLSRPGSSRQRATTTRKRRKKKKKKKKKSPKATPKASPKPSPRVSPEKLIIGGKKAVSPNREWNGVRMPREKARERGSRTEMSRGGGISQTARRARAQVRYSRIRSSLPVNSSRRLKPASASASARQGRYLQPRQFDNDRNKSSTATGKVKMLHIVRQLWDLLQKMRGDTEKLKLLHFYNEKIRAKREEMDSSSSSKKKKKKKKSFFSEKNKNNNSVVSTDSEVLSAIKRSASSVPDSNESKINSEMFLQVLCTLEKTKELILHYVREVEKNVPQKILHKARLNVQSSRSRRDDNTISDMNMTPQKSSSSINFNVLKMINVGSRIRLILEEMQGMFSKAANSVGKNLKHLVTCEMQKMVLDVAGFFKIVKMCEKIRTEFMEIDNLLQELVNACRPAAPRSHRFSHNAPHSNSNSNSNPKRNKEARRPKTSSVQKSRGAWRGRRKSIEVDKLPNRNSRNVPLLGKKKRSRKKNISTTKRRVKMEGLKFSCTAIPLRGEKDERPGTLFENDERGDDAGFSQW